MSRSNKQVLVVDDEEIVRSTLTAFLDLMGHQVASAEDGEAALSALNEAPYDIAFIDVQMAGMNGYDLTSRIREAWPHIHVCLMAGFQNSELTDRALQLGTSGVLAKPFKLEEVEQFLEDAGDVEAISPPDAGATS